VTSGLWRLCDDKYVQLSLSTILLCNAVVELTCFLPTEGANTVNGPTLPRTKVILNPVSLHLPPRDQIPAAGLARLQNESCSSTPSLLQTLHYCIYCRLRWKGSWSFMRSYAQAPRGISCSGSSGSKRVGFPLRYLLSLLPHGIDRTLSPPRRFQSGSLW
jgi:hypothetical protein